jgi:hypothetical protein
MTYPTGSFDRPRKVSPYGAAAGFFIGWWTPSYLEHQCKDDKSKQWEKDGFA